MKITINRGQPGRNDNMNKLERIDIINQLLLIEIDDFMKATDEQDLKALDALVDASESLENFLYPEFGKEPNSND
jgi:hypothetical protein